MWCEGKCFLEGGIHRTLGFLVNWYKLHIENGAKQSQMKDLKNVINSQLVYLDKNLEAEIRHLIPPPKLHLLIGIVIVYKNTLE